MTGTIFCERYAGQWVATVEDRAIVSADSLDEVARKVPEADRRRVRYTLVPPACLMA